MHMHVIILHSRLISQCSRQCQQCIPIMYKQAAQAIQRARSVQVLTVTTYIQWPYLQNILRFTIKLT